jgi:hypothetical protein
MCHPARVLDLGEKFRNAIPNRSTRKPCSRAWSDHDRKICLRLRSGNTNRATEERSIEGSMEALKSTYPKSIDAFLDRS